jgi:hypothetical protein
VVVAAADDALQDEAALDAWGALQSLLSRRRSAFGLMVCVMVMVMGGGGGG